MPSRESLAKHALSVDDSFWDTLSKDPLPETAFYDISPIVTRDNASRTENHVYLDSPTLTLFLESDNVSQAISTLGSLFYESNGAISRNEPYIQATIQKGGHKKSLVRIYLKALDDNDILLYAGTTPEIKTVDSINRRGIAENRLRSVRLAGYNKFLKSHNL